MCIFLGRKEKRIKKTIDDKPPIPYSHCHVSYHKKKDVVVLSTTLKKKRVVQQEVLFALFKKHGRLTYVKELFKYKN
jgi:hypothetical protein